MGSTRLAEIDPNIGFNEMINTLKDNQVKNSYYIRVFQQIQNDGMPTFSPSLTKNKEKINAEETNYLNNMFNKNQTSSTTKDVVSEDNYELILYQNTMYIAGTIACASLIIGAVILSRNG